MPLWQIGDPWGQVREEAIFLVNRPHLMQYQKNSEVSLLFTLLQSSCLPSQVRVLLIRTLSPTMLFWEPTLNPTRRTKQISLSEKVLVQYNEYNSKIARQVLVSLKAIENGPFLYGL